MAEIENPFAATSNPIPSPDPVSTGNPPDTGNATPSLEDLTRKVLNKATAEPPKKRRGRPPKNPNASSSMPASGVPSGPTVEVSPTPTVDKRIVEDFVSTLLTTIDLTITDSVRSNALAITESKPMAQNLADKVAIKPGEKELVAKLSGLCAEQYQVGGEHAPLFFLVLTLGGYGVRVGLTIRQLRQLAIYKARLQAQAAKE